MNDRPEFPDRPPTPIEMGIRPGVTFDEASQPREPSEVESNRQTQTVNGRRVVRIDASLVDDNREVSVPGGTRTVRWVVEMGSNVVLLGEAFPNGVAGSGVADDGRTDSMDVAENAAVLDAMMRSVVLTQPFTNTSAATPQAPATTAISPSPNSSGAQTPIVVEALSDPCLRQRSGPTTTDALVGCVPKGTRVTVECAVDGEMVVGLDGYETMTWDRISHKGKAGYISDAWVNPSGYLAPPC